MLTPYTVDDRVDLPAIDRYVDWLIATGATGLFPVALSGEMYELDESERLDVASRVVRRAVGRVPVAAAIAAAGSAEDTSRAAARLAETGVDVVVLIASIVLGEDDDESRFIEVAERALAENPSVRFGVYECPLPYHRLFSQELIGWIADTGRFAFFKETSHDVDMMAARIRAGAPRGLQVFNAGIEDHVDAMKVGVAGLSGWVANVAPDLVAELAAEFTRAGASDRAIELQRRLVEIEQRMGPTYPSSAKAVVEARAGLGFQTVSRWRPAEVDPADVDAIVDLIEGAR